MFFYRLPTNHQELTTHGLPELSFHVHTTLKIKALNFVSEYQSDDLTSLSKSPQWKLLESNQ